MKIPPLSPSLRERNRAVLEAHPDVVRASSGAAAHAVGESFEAFLERHHRTAIELGIAARLVHTGPPTKHVYRRGVLQLVATGDGPADYVGQLADGTSVAIEAKSRAGRLRRDEIPAHQVADLDACANGNGLALLVVEFRIAGRVTVAAIPWIEVPWRVLRTAASLGPEDVEAWRVEGGDRCYLSRFVVPGDRGAEEDARAVSTRVRAGGMGTASSGASKGVV